MKVNNINSTNFLGTRVFISRNSAQNKAVKFLDNKVIDFLSQHKTTAQVSGKGIELMDASNELLEKISKAGIKFDKVV